MMSARLVSGNKIFVKAGLQTLPEIAYLPELNTKYFAVVYLKHVTALFADFRSESRILK